MRMSTEKEFEKQLEPSEEKNWADFFAVYISSHRYDKLLVMQMYPHPKIWFKDTEIEYCDLIRFLESLEIKKHKHEKNK